MKIWGRHAGRIGLLNFMKYLIVLSQTMITININCRSKLYLIAKTGLRKPGYEE